jgi:prolyl-tRNA synthetase
MVETPAGEDYIVVCEATGYAANLEKAVSRPAPPAVADCEEDLAPEPVHTPGQKTIEQVTAFLGVPATSVIKTLVLVADGAPVVALVRGDHQLSETKFQSATGCQEFRAARPEEMRELFGAEAGSLGPVGLAGPRLLADLALRGRRNLVSGANRDDYHLRNVTPEEDFRAEFFDLRQVAEGDTEIETGAPLRIQKTVEIGHIFKLGYKYSRSMGLNVQDQNGNEVPVIMGSYGIGIERVLCAAVELFGDENGIRLPVSIAPFEVVVTPVKSADASLRAAGDELYAALQAAGIDVLYDDRDLSPGVKFKDADLIGVPFRVTIGKKLPQGLVEVVSRDTKKVTEVAVADVAAVLRKMIDEITPEARS